MNLLSTATILDGQVVFLKSSLIILYLILAALALSCLVFTLIMLRSSMEGMSSKVLLVALYLVTCFVLISAIVCTGKYNTLQAAPTTEQPRITAPPATADIPTDSATEPSTLPESIFAPLHTANSDPANWEIKWDIMQNSTVLDSYTHAEDITFGDAEAYTAIEGITTFRGNNYRNSATYGTADVINQTITERWQAKVGSFNGWSGCGWTGQPLIVRWEEETKAIMNLYQEKKTKANLVEVIYATLDGHIYFYDLDDGSYTRDPINVGMNLKSGGTLDPRGYPLMYVGSGDSSNKTPRMYIINLIEGKVIFEQSGSDIDAYHRWFAFDSTPLVDGETDTLIWPGESGILYITKLNTVYQKDAGIITVTPDNVVKLRYKTNLGRSVGTKASSIIAENYLYYAENGGMLFCVDLKTMQLVWAQDTHDSVYATPVFQKGENGSAYIYTGTITNYAENTAYIQKLDARTGEIIWEYALENIAHNATSPGGVLSSPILGKPDTALEGIIIYSVSRTPTTNRGTLVALDTETGELVWQQVLRYYAWSSPAAVYTDDGAAYFVLCDTQGKVALFDGTTGTVLNYLELGSSIESSPAVFENTVVVGTRGEYVYGFTIE